MNGEVLEVLKQIREEAKGTNARLDQTNARLDSVDARLQLVEGKVEFLSRSVIKGFADVRETLDDHAAQIKRLIAGQTEAMHHLHDVIVARLDDHAVLLNHEQRLHALEQRQ